MQEESVRGIRSRPQRLKRWFIMGTASLLASAGAAVGLTAAPASAATLYNISPTRACQLQGHFGASAWNTGPYGWYCYDLTTTPPFWAPAGGVDFQKYCSYFYPGSRAIIYTWDLYGWRCSR
jgi:hypothetical protein